MRVMRVVLIARRVVEKRGVMLLKLNLLKLFLRVCITVIPASVGSTPTFIEACWRSSTVKVQVVRLVFAIFWRAAMQATSRFLAASHF